MRRFLGSGLALGIMACGPYDAFPEVPCGTADLTFATTADGFEPAEGTVKYGGQVRWQNDDTVAHEVSDGAPSDEDAGSQFDATIEPGGAFCVEARESGDQPFFDEDGIGGVLTVEARPAGGGGGGGGGYGYRM